MKSIQTNPLVILESEMFPKEYSNWRVNAPSTLHWSRLDAAGLACSCVTVATRVFFLNRIRVRPKKRLHGNTGRTHKGKQSLFTIVSNLLIEWRVPFPSRLFRTSPPIGCVQRRVPVQTIKSKRVEVVCWRQSIHALRRPLGAMNDCYQARFPKRVDYARYLMDVTCVMLKALRRDVELAAIQHTFRKSRVCYSTLDRQPPLPPSIHPSTTDQEGEQRDRWIDTAECMPVDCLKVPPGPECIECGVGWSCYHDTCSIQSRRNGLLEYHRV